VTAIVQQWVIDPNQNFGMMLNSDAVAGSDSFRYFAASEVSDAQQRPKLTVTFTNR
jgi:hypothetical protein